MRGQPLMPTTPAKARKLLRDGKAKVVRREPFTIRLNYATGEAKQEITLGVDAGSKVAGLYHNGTLKLNLKRGQSFKDAAFMEIMRWTLYEKLKEQYPNVKTTYGYITKNTRIHNELPKGHRIDALCITGNPKAKRLDHWYYIKKIRRHNRQIHKANILKGGTKKLHQALYLVKGFRLFDKVRYQKQEGFIFGRRSSGYFDLRRLDRTSIHKSANYKKLGLLQKRSGYLVEERRRLALPPTT
ncbi:MAG TPA: hypothetical protein DDZ89_11710 [Clostridiales bacterium]|nr:hypothetical protein [Clostridiales bacterium]